MRARWTPLAMVVAAAVLAACGRRSEDPAVSAEIERREKFARNLLTVDGGIAPALRVGSSTRVHFEEGFSSVTFDPPDSAFSHAFRWMGKRGHVRLKTKGARPMHLRVAGWMNERVLHQRGSVSAYINGQSIAMPAPTDEKGIFVIDLKVDSPLFETHDWVDLELVPSSVAFHWADPPDLKVIVLFDFVWEPS